MIQSLPALNASLNALATCFLFAGYVYVKRGDRQKHIRCMVTAVAISGLFLTSYLIYHFNVEMVTYYQGRGVLRAIYFFILLTHIPLAAIIVPLVAWAVYTGAKEKLTTHRKIVKWLWPMWMYVSITGVLIYLMLYQLPQQL